MSIFRFVILVVFAFLVAGAGTAWACDCVVRDAGGRLLGRIDGVSALRNSSGRLVGRLDGWDADCVFPVTAYLMFFDPRHNR
jgi:hypothetical protein